jgi:hypothetical protein
MATLETNIRQVNSDFQAIKSKIIESGVEVPEGTKTMDYAVKVGEVFEAGKKAEYDEVWDDSKAEYDYVCRFAGRYWSDYTFKPKYDLKLQYNCQRCFTNTRIVDLKKCIDDAGVTFSTKYMTTGQMLFYYSNQLTRVPTLDLSDCTASEYTTEGIFQECRSLVTIEKLIISEGTKFKFSNSFLNCHNLENLVIEGTLGTTGLNLQWSTKLSKASITSIINCLSSTTSGLSITLSETAVNNAFTTEEWEALESTKPNWIKALIP